MQALFVWVPFFAAYAFAAQAFMRWLAARYVARRLGNSRVSILSTASAATGILALAAMPPCLELALRVLLDWRLGTAGFVLFVAAWVLSVVPGAQASRYVLHEAGIDPDV